MKEKILRLCKRLNKFALNEIELISEVPKNELLPVLEELTNEKKLLFKGDIYFYNKEITISKRISKLPLMFQYHKPETIDLIIKCFCAEISVEKVYKIVSLNVDCIVNFNKYFRETLYKKQLEELKIYFNKSPQIPGKRNFFNNKFFFYCYNNKIFVSEIELPYDKAKNYSKSEQKYFKTIYSKLRRRLNHNAQAYYTHLHLTEHLWRNNKIYDDLLEELNFLLFFNIC